MNRIAFVRDDGFINHCFLPDDQTTYVDGEERDGFEVHFFPYSEDPIKWMDTKFWDFDTGEWATIPTKPSGNYYTWDTTQKNYVIDREAMKREVRLERNKKLADTDWMMVRDTPLETGPVFELKAYRQELRDLMATINFDELEDLSAITWPTPPDFL